MQNELYALDQKGIGKGKRQPKARVVRKVRGGRTRKTGGWGWEVGIRVGGSRQREAQIKVAGSDMGHICPRTLVLGVSWRKPGSGGRQ